MNGWSSHAGRLAGALAMAGMLQDPAWWKAFATTPRHVFVPRFYRLDTYNQPRHLVEGEDRSQRGFWWEHVYNDEVLVTHYQVIGAMPDGQEIRVASSSASTPSVTAVMLDRLKVADGHRILEIGTGTGYTTALLANRLGDQQITSIEIDPATAAEAAQHLATAGLAPTLTVGDGHLGYPPHSPYDRILSTCAIDHIPPAWIEQLVEGGIIVAPLTYGGGPLAVLHKTGPDSLTGRLDHEQAHFMPIRGSGTASPPVNSIPAMTGAVHTRHTGVPPAVWSDEEWLFWLSIHHPPPMSIANQYDTENFWCGITVYTPTRRGSVDYTSEFSTQRWPVTEGDNTLWHEVDTAWETWKRHGWPTRSRIGITATSHSRLVFWLDRPEQPIPETPPEPLTATSGATTQTPENRDLPSVRQM